MPYSDVSPPIRFYLMRHQDVSGVSGVGRVAEGIIFHDGQVALSWFGFHHCVSIWPSIESVEAIHGHGGMTAIDYIDDPPSG